MLKSWGQLASLIATHTLWSCACDSESEQHQPCTHTALTCLSMFTVCYLHSLWDNPHGLKCWPDQGVSVRVLLHECYFSLFVLSCLIKQQQHISIFIPLLPSSAPLRVLIGVLYTAEEEWSHSAAAEQTHKNRAEQRAHTFQLTTEKAQSANGSFEISGNIDDVIRTLCVSHHTRSGTSCYFIFLDYCFSWFWFSLLFSAYCNPITFFK